MITTLNVAELLLWLGEKRRFALIDVLPEEYFHAQRLPEARRACVYEVDFLNQIEKLGIPHGEPVVLYGAGNGSLDSRVAAEKLERAGFTELFDFSGGRAAWAKAGGAFKGDGNLPAPPAAPREHTYVVDLEKSAVEWIGRNLNSTHRGIIRIARGEMVVRDGKMESGTVVIDMRSIENTDLPDSTMRHLLETHLKSDDFFHVEQFPTAELVLKSASALADATPGTPNQRIAADLTIKDVTHPIEFPAIVALDESGNLTAVAEIEINRTCWNVLYGSGRFFQMLGKHLVNDAIMLLVKIVAR